MPEVKRSSKRAKSGLHPAESHHAGPPMSEQPVIINVPHVDHAGSLTIVAPVDLPTNGSAGNGQTFVQYITPTDGAVPVTDAAPSSDDAAETPAPTVVASPSSSAAVASAAFTHTRTTNNPGPSDHHHGSRRHDRLAEPPVPPASETPAAPDAPSVQLPPNPLVFECAWEVCWQLGGIYTVIRSKTPQMTRLYGDRYFLIGPYNADTAAVELEYTQPTGPVAAAIEKLRAMGFIVHFGRWLVTGRPQVILIDFRAVMSDGNRMGEVKYLLWKDHGIQAPDADWEINAVAAFGFVVGLFFQQLVSVPEVQLPVLAHFHEWMGGLGAMRIRCLKLPVATVFTTHATLLGRYLCTDNPDFYQKLPWINPEHAAGHYNIYWRYCIERGATHTADIFTTVSDITGMEAEKLLARKPDVITPNGLNIHKFAALHEFQNIHKQNKEIIHQFVAAHFFPSYHFDLDKTIYLFTSGRYEYGNKGMDLFIESLARLNHWLRAGNIPITVVAFIITRAPHKNINVDVLRSQAMFDELKGTCDRITEDMGHSLLSCVCQGRLPGAGDLLHEEATVKLKRAMHAWRTWKQPAIITHDLWDDANDPVLKQLRTCQLFNARHDPVKVVFHPDFLSATSPLIGLDYDQFVRGCHMGVFPSYYEPWGYTPAECIASGVPAVTSDLAGFGSYVLKNVQDPQSKGMFIIGRRYASFEQSAHQLTETLFNFALKDRRARIELRNRTERLSELFDWSNLVAHYTEAYHRALTRAVIAQRQAS